MDEKPLGDQGKTHSSIYISINLFIQNNYNFYSLRSYITPYYTNLLNKHRPPLHRWPRLHRFGCHEEKFCYINSGRKLWQSPSRPLANLQTWKQRLNIENVITRDSHVSFLSVNKWVIQFSNYQNLVIMENSMLMMYLWENISIRYHIINLLEGGDMEN